MSAKILVVDDVLPNVKLLEIKLTNEYYDVRTAMNGPEALKSVQQDKPDLVLLDVMMPGMSGYEVCQILKENPETADIPIIMVTALTDTADRVKGLEAGADDFLSKPVNDIALFARVRSLLRLKMTMDQLAMRQHTSDQLGMDQTNVTPMKLAADEAEVLVVEDCAPDAYKISEVLEKDKDHAVLVKCQTEALEKIEENQFDLILLSINLHNEDGLRLLSYLRSSNRSRHTPILLIANKDDTERLAKGLELGANDYIMRPFDSNELLARVRSQVRRKRYNDKLHENYETSISMALTDSLTGLYNRRYVTTHLEKQFELFNEQNKPFSVLMMDIDHFKKVNDTHGHDVGDEVLKEFAHRLKQSVRSFDLAARIGGEEFVAVLPETEVGVAAMIADRLRETIATDAFPISSAPGSLRVTMSVGVGEARRGDANTDTILKRADNGLYGAKNSGRNRVCVGADVLSDNGNGSAEEDEDEYHAFG